MLCVFTGENIQEDVIYPPTEHSERSHRSVLLAARLAEAKGEAVYGIKGVSPMSTALNLVDLIPVDYMHAVLEGVTRSLLKHWFVAQYHSGASYIGSKLKTIKFCLGSNLLMSLAAHHVPLKNISSTLRHQSCVPGFVTTHFLYYLAIFHLFFFHHYALLVCAIHILLQDEITSSLVDAAESMLRDFCSLLPELYGQELHC